MFGFDSKDDLESSLEIPLGQDFHSKKDLVNSDIKISIEREYNFPAVKKIYSVLYYPAFKRIIFSLYGKVIIFDENTGDIEKEIGFYSRKMYLAKLNEDICLSCSSIFGEKIDSVSPINMRTVSTDWMREVEKGNFLSTFTILSDDLYMFAKESEISIFKFSNNMLYKKINGKDINLKINKNSICTKSKKYNSTFYIYEDGMFRMINFETGGSVNLVSKQEYSNDPLEMFVFNNSENDEILVSEMPTMILNFILFYMINTKQKKENQKLEGKYLEIKTYQSFKPTLVLSNKIAIFGNRKKGIISAFDPCQIEESKKCHFGTEDVMFVKSFFKKTNKRSNYIDAGISGILFHSYKGISLRILVGSKSGKFRIIKIKGVRLDIENSKGSKYMKEDLVERKNFLFCGDDLLKNTQLKIKLKNLNFFSLRIMLYK